MSRSLRLLLWTLLALLLVLLMILSSSVRKGPDRQEQGQTPRIAMVLGMRHGDYWKTVYLGAQAAARERGANVSFLGPDYEEDFKGQAEEVRQAMADGMDALVLAPNDDVALADIVDEVSQKAPVITIDSHVNSDKVSSHIGTDNYAAGVKAGEELARLLGPGRKRIGLIGFAQGTLKADQREKGVLDAIAKHPSITVVDKSYSLSDQGLAQELTRQMLERYGPLDGLVALNATSSVGAAEEVRRAGYTGSVKLVAFDSSLRELELLQEGTIQATVVQNPFRMGYLSVMHALDVLEERHPPASVDTGSKVVRTDDMFSNENQKLLFPLLQ